MDVPRLPVKPKSEDTENPMTGSRTVIHRSEKREGKRGIHGEGGGRKGKFRGVKSTNDICVCMGKHHEPHSMYDYNIPTKQTQGDWQSRGGGGGEKAKYGELKGIK